MSVWPYVGLAVVGSVVVAVALAVIILRRVQGLSARVARAEIERDAARGNEDDRAKIAEIHAKHLDRERAIGVLARLRDKYGSPPG